MAETQMSMFGDSEQLHALIDRLDDIPDDELKKNWPGTLRDLVDVISAELHRQGIEPAQAGMLARKVAAAQAGYPGRVNSCLPSVSLTRRACCWKTGSVISGFPSVIWPEPPSRSDSVMPAINTG